MVEILQAIAAILAVNPTVGLVLIILAVIPTIPYILLWMELKEVRKAIDKFIDFLIDNTKIK